MFLIFNEIFIYLYRIHVKNKLTKRVKCVNNHNALICSYESGVFAREKHRFLLPKAKGTLRGGRCPTSEK